MKVDGHPSRGRPRRRWMDCVKDDMNIKGVSMEMTSDRREWKKKCPSDGVFSFPGFVGLLILSLWFLSLMSKDSDCQTQRTLRFIFCNQGLSYITLMLN
jgi:hypothetical protein